MTSAREPEARLVAARYRTEAVLGRGAMGEVLRVRDEASGTRLALKRLTRPGDRRAEAWFEREYHTLGSLRHPRIVQVFEYGHSELGPYYTMELLEGADLRELAPLPYAQACRYLADVASSLALLHARRLLHRDVNARNVRATADQHCKLIDFGALSTFGGQREVVGTPPCIAPEALRGLPLDQRTDLYALGTLAYYVLTGRQARPVRRIDELAAALQAPLRAPSVVLDGCAAPGQERFIPRELDALVMSLLSLDPLERPSCAAEVIEQLSQIAEIETAPIEVARGYLAGGRLVGRERELGEIRAAVAETRAGHGGGLLVAGVAGVGKTRLLVELSLQAQLAGAVVARADAAQHGGPYGVVRELMARLCAVLPGPARAAARTHAELLARLCPELGETLAGARRGNALAATPGELRKRTQVALRTWFLALCEGRCLALIVDDLHCADEASISLLSRLSSAGKDHGLLVCASVDLGQLERGSPSLRARLDAARVLQPEPLDADQTLELVRGLFGDVPNLKRLAHFSHDRASGLPQRILELGDALIAARVLRSLDGLWVIPEQLEGCGLDVHDGAALAEARLGQLSAQARAAAELLTLQRGALPLDLWLALARAEGQRDVFSALAELCGSGIVVECASGLRFASEWLRAHVAARLAPERRARLHRELGLRLLACPDPDTGRRLAAGFHLVRGGEQTRGADLLAELGLELVHDADEMSAAAPALEAALAIYVEQRRNVRELCSLLGPLAVAGYRADLRLAQTYGEQAVVLQEQLLGLTLSRKLRPWLGARLSLYAGLVVAALRFVCGRGRRGLGAFVDAITLFVASCNSLCGAAATCLDAPAALRYARALEPLSWLGHHHVCGVAYRYSQALSLIAQDRQAECAPLLREVVETCETRAVACLPAGGRSLLLGGAYYASGVLAAFRAGEEALDYAGRLESVGLRIYDLAANQVRATHYANRGQMQLANEYRRRVELHAIEAGSGWQAEVWEPCAALNGAAIVRDLMQVKRAAEQLELLAERIPSLRLYAQVARGAYVSQHGEPAELDRYAQWLCALPPRSFNGWASAIGMLGYMFNQRGEHARARALCGHALAQLSQRDLAYIALTLKLEVHHAMARAGLGDPRGAADELEALLARCGVDAGPLAPGFVHEHLARVHALAGDRPRALEHAAVMTQHYAETGHPGLIALGARLRAELGTAARAGSAPPAAFALADTERSAAATSRSASTAVTSVSRRIAR